MAVGAAGKQGTCREIRASLRIVKFPQITLLVAADPTVSATIAAAGWRPIVSRVCPGRDATVTRARLGQMPIGFRRWSSLIVGKVAPGRHRQEQQR